ncbi:MAG: DUF2617 family protein [Planctomycetia bacterium]
MNGNLIVRPTTADLTFQVFDRWIHPEFFETLLLRTFERDGYKLSIRLTPAGHVVEWRREGHTLVEVLGDQSTPLPDHRLLFGHRIAGERSEQYRPAPEITYQTCFQLERLTPELFFHLNDEIRADGEKTGVLYLLRPQDRLGLSPISYLDPHARKNSLILHSYHTYPDEYAVVKTQTLIEVAE